MKKIIYTGVFFLVALLVSCYEDLGNYEYTDLNSVKIEKIEDRTCAKGDVLDIIPAITLNGDTLGDAERYEYSWVACNRSVPVNEVKQFLLGNERNLYYQMNLPSGDYTLVFTVKDKETDLQWIIRFDLKVTGAITEGWLLLTETEQPDGKRLGDLSVYAKNPNDGTFRLLNNILEFSDFPYRYGPRKVVYKKAFGMSKGEIHVLTDEAVGWLDDQTDLWKEDQLIKYANLEAVGNNYTLKDFVFFPMARQSYGFTENGGIKVRGEMSAGAVWGTDIGYIMEKGKKVNLELAPYIGGFQGGGTGMAYLLFDQKSRTFITCSWPNPSSNEANCAKWVDPNAATGKEMIYMQSVGSTGIVYALLKDSENKIWQYKFTIMAGMMVMLDPVSGIKELDAPHLSQAQQITYNQTYTDFLYYSVGNELYTYYDGREKLVKTMNGEITCLKSQFIDISGNYSEEMKYLVVATYEKSDDSEKGEGQLTLFLPTPGKADVLQVADEVKHLEKVISIDYQRK